MKSGSWISFGIMLLMSLVLSSRFQATESLLYVYLGVAAIALVLKLIKSINLK
ncbi:hypothetical protein IQ249_03710 [Lusitaniella coriacea LEGE 07157]|uniref:Uncharacterized protein n=1 Tax=Lusitaniella coriacea LEGE 07157 TaxID=945747 RepID=A0A8J7DNQ4_9CYAN|nr:hypothetical protein [Lusitaniella coriacea]MBE9114999.1 hypothetical protein [Lusitaniella coriacea LEGE 07157]